MNVQGIFDLYWRLGGGILKVDGYNDVSRPLGYGVNRMATELD